MPIPYKFYLEHLQNSYKYRGTWDPGLPLELGQVGKLENGIFTQYTTLQKQGIVIEPPVEASKVNLDLSTHQSVTIDVKLAGAAVLPQSALSEADAGFSIHLNSDKAIVFKLGDYKTCEIPNLDDVENAVLEKYKEGTWKKEWVVITRLLKASSATIIISTSSNGLIELKAAAKVGAPDLKITDASLGLSIAKEKGGSINFIAQSGLTPLYRVMGIRKPWLGNPKFKTKSLDEKEEGPFEEQAFDPRELEEDE